MMLFKENRCRLCKQVLCCKNCRENHEISVHNIYIGCDICVNGKAVIRDPDEALLAHIKEKHWPLHCIKCNTFFKAPNELVNKCPLAKKIITENSAKTPMGPPTITRNSSHYDSPPIGNILKFTPSSTELFVNSRLNHLKTSTPMQLKTEIEFSDLSEVTPVLRQNQNYAEENSENVLNEGESYKDHSSKRRVTFNESPIYETCVQTASQKKSLKSSLKKSKDKSNRSSVGCYEFSPDTPVQNKDIKIEKNNDHEFQTPKALDNTTIWESALYQVEEITEGGSHIKTTQLETWSCSEIACDDTKNVPVKPEERKSTNQQSKNVQAGIWSSMTNLVKHFMSGLSSHSEDTEVKIAVKTMRTPKRQRLDDSIEDVSRFKKMKFTDIKGRKPINDTLPYQLLRKRTKAPTSDKSTQTD